MSSVDQQQQQQQQEQTVLKTSPSKTNVPTTDPQMTSDQFKSLPLHKKHPLAKVAQKRADG